MSREDDVKKEMARIKASKHYQDYQEEHAPVLAEEKALAKLAPWRMGVTEDGKSEVWAPVVGPGVAKVAHLKRRVWVCSWCRCTMRFRGRGLQKNVLVDFDGNVYHRACFHEMKRLGDELVGKKGAGALPAKKGESE